MDYPTLKIIHLTGLALTFMGLAGVLAIHAAGGAPSRTLLVFRVAQGLGLLLLLFSGFGLAGKLGALQPVPGWLKAKMVVWLLTGGSIVLATRFSRFTVQVLLAFIFLVVTAAWLAIEKPF